MTVYIKIDSNWFDVTNFKNHPGGTYVLKRYHLKDATKAFNEVIHMDGLVLLLMEKYKVKDINLIESLNKLQY